MVKMVVINGIRYSPAKAAKLGHKAMTPEPAPKPVVVAEAEAEAEEEETVEEPSKGGSKTAWQAFAKALGATEEQLEGLSRDELAETYGA
jgi:predicted component of type VI protein secretion system